MICGEFPIGEKTERKKSLEVDLTTLIPKKIIFLIL